LQEPVQLALQSSEPGFALHRPVQSAWHEPVQSAVADTLHCPLQLA
jgi:hypothetical protein